MAYKHLIEISFGAVLGAGLTYVHTYFQLKEVRKQNHRLRTRALHAEMLDLKALLHSGMLDGPAKVRISRDMWEECKGEIFEMPDAAVEAIRRLYLKVDEFNSLIDYHLHHAVQFTPQLFESCLAQMKGLIDPAINGIDAYQGKIS